MSRIHPFASSYGNIDEEEMRKKTRNNTLSFSSPVWRGISFEAKRLIDGLLKTNPKERWTIDMVLASNWIQNDSVWLQQMYKKVVQEHWSTTLKHFRTVQLSETPKSSAVIGFDTSSKFGAHSMTKKREFQTGKQGKWDH
ncbi:MAP kinase-activated protein kinase 2 [Lunasporangiospora selenospora]|uniref:MAP kinase-activated protein kinase 2 n=1 Tax=Lunasporangiospora selenospora TaxID=979761 RepID=A0A9P6FLE2_9FUNG|nr:MAP kinase-activated protein kinase 2 [Lunasporangiospora selenospora]